MENLKEIQATAADKLIAVDSEIKLAEFKAFVFGKSGLVTELMKTLKSLPNDQKPQAGKEINDLRVAISTMIENKEKNCTVWR